MCPVFLFRLVFYTVYVQVWECVNSCDDIFYVEAGLCEMVSNLGRIGS